MINRAFLFCALFSFLMSRCGTSDATKTTAAPEPATLAQTTATTTVEPQPPARATLIDILRDPILWGPDYPAALEAIPAFDRAGEQQVMILPRRVVGRQVRTQAEAQRAASVARDAYASPPPMRVAVVDPAGTQRRLPPLTAILFPDDRKYHLGTPDHDALYIAVNVRIDQLEARWGKAERVTKEVIDDGTERRPIELTLYHFAGGAVIVVTTDVHSDPRVIDRVFLDSRAVVQAIF